MRSNAAYSLTSPALMDTIILLTGPSKHLVDAVAPRVLLVSASARCAGVGPPHSDVLLCSRCRGSSGAHPSPRHSHTAELLAHSPAQMFPLCSGQQPSGPWDSSQATPASPNQTLPLFCHLCPPRAELRLGVSFPPHLLHHMSHRPSLHGTCPAPPVPLKYRHQATALGRHNVISMMITQPSASYSAQEHTSASPRTVPKAGLELRRELSTWKRSLTTTHEGETT